MTNALTNSPFALMIKGLRPVMQVPNSVAPIQAAKSRKPAGIPHWTEYLQPSDTADL